MKIRFSTAGYRYCCLSFLLIAIICCSVSRGYAQNYYPDEFGNTWILRSTDGLEERLVTIEGPETIGGESLKVISDGTYPVSNPASNNPNKFFIKATPNEVQIFRVTATIQGFDATIDYSPPETFLPVPIELDTEWTVVGEAKVLLFGVEIKIPTTTVAKVVAIEDVTVPAGTFHDCLKIEQQISTSGLVTSSQQIAMWLAPDFGLVQSLDSNGVIFELHDYDVTIDGPVVAVEPKEKLATTWGAVKKR